MHRSPQHVAHAWAWALGVFVVSWYVQIHLGHMVLEERRPALLDSFFQVKIDFSTWFSHIESPESTQATWYRSSGGLRSWTAPCRQCRFCDSFCSHQKYHMRWLCRPLK